MHSMPHLLAISSEAQGILTWAIPLGGFLAVLVWYVFLLFAAGIPSDGDEASVACELTPSRSQCRVVRTDWTRLSDALALCPRLDLFARTQMERETHRRCQERQEQYDEYGVQDDRDRHSGPPLVTSVTAANFAAGA